MSTGPSDHYVTVSSVFTSYPFVPDVEVRWTEWPEVGPRIYPTPLDAATALRWGLDRTVTAINNGGEWHTFTPIDYDPTGKQSIQGESASCLRPSHCGPD